MILDHLPQWPRYANINPRFKRGFEYLLQMPADPAEGRHEIDGDDVFAIVVKTTTTPLDGAQFEAHRKYIDVHYVLQGREGMAWSPLASLDRVTMPFDSEQDAALYELIPAAQLIPVLQGQFAIFFPEDGHIPSCAITVPEPVVKVVLKIRL